MKNVPYNFVIRTESANLSNPFQSRKGINFLKNSFDTVFYEKGQLIFRENTPAWGLYYLRQGKIKLYKYGSDGKEQIFKIAGSGEFIGYTALLNDTKHHVSAFVLEDVIINFVPKEIFLQEFGRQNDVAQYFIHLLCQDLMEAENKLVSQSYCPVRGRLADTLLSLHKTYHENNDESMIKISRQDLASLLGTAKETVIRILSEFKAEKLIALDGRCISVINPLGLMKINHLYD